MNFGENAQSWLGDQVGALFIVIIAAVAIYYLVKREFSKFVGFAVFAAFVSIFVFAGENIKDLGQDLWSRIFR
ncbi:hypothetical protein NYE34_21370 [Bacillus sp. FSL R5-0418]|uniref:hypothetical protein n=1 Tax=Bacillus TaxID=1386 RepID=UPI000EF1C462|nr:hypothetical protein [Bacillus subtilis]AYK59829.1 hypothetical protein D9C10_22620 [Bacillus subtilis subsp. subtilis]